MPATHKRRKTCGDLFCELRKRIRNRPKQKFPLETIYETVPAACRNCDHLYGEPACPDNGGEYTCRKLSDFEENGNKLWNSGRTADGNFEQHAPVWQAVLSDMPKIHICMPGICKSAGREFLPFVQAGNLIGFLVDFLKNSYTMWVYKRKIESAKKNIQKDVLFFLPQKKYFF